MIKIEAKKQILNAELYPDLKMYDTSLLELRPCLIIKGITFKEAQDNLSELKKYGIVELVEIKGKDAKYEVKLVKGICETDANRDEIISDKVIIVRQKKLYIEHSMRQPKMCHKCSSLEHLEEDCEQEKKLCPTCSQESHEGQCQHEKKCINCNETNSSRYKNSVHYY